MSWSPKILARDSIAVATLFSKPEYVWTTNHCLVAVARLAHFRITFHDAWTGATSTAPRYSARTTTTTSTTTVDLEFRAAAMSGSAS